MPESWANYGIDLHLELAGQRVRAAIESTLRDAVLTGRLRPGQRLPSSRDLAADLGLARNTVADAYGQLVAEGWLTARTGSGTWVAQRPVAQPRRAQTAAAESQGPRFDLRAGTPAVSLFPRRQWLAASRAALAAAHDDILGYPDPRGVPELRTALAGYLARARGVLVSPDRIIVCAGFANGLALICGVLRGRGHRAIATEAFGHGAHRRIAQAQGLAAMPLAVDALGAVPAGLAPAGQRAASERSGPSPAGQSPASERSGPMPGAALLTPAHQYPLGVTLAAPRRAAFLAWAAESGGLVIEDDYDGEFRYDRQPVGAMQALAPEQVVYAGTASKSLAPGLRLGWLAAPASVMDEIIAAKESSACHNSVLDQLTIARLIHAGGYDRQIRQARLVYRRRRDHLVAALRARAPSVRLTGIAAGQHVVAELPGHVSEYEVIARAAGHGVAVEGLAGYAAPGHAAGPALVIGYGRPADHAFTTAVGRLCAALADVIG